eukprot:TRINITY_DN24343_c0_g1_i13.p1 TRINITY_DN24343_c0_g1~~TRINITY_DN24343_c0_g1_i13.p1  ORF type:complete len:497 (-),score=90.81 TRINITY_DN24343_c0_g1_i13:447-1937(-)
MWLESRLMGGGGSCTAPGYTSCTSVGYTCLVLASLLHLTASRPQDMCEHLHNNNIESVPNFPKNCSTPLCSALKTSLVAVCQQGKGIDLTTPSQDLQSFCQNKRSYSIPEDCKISGCQELKDTAKKIFETPEVCSKECKSSENSLSGVCWNLDLALQKLFAGGNAKSEEAQQALATNAVGNKDSLISSAVNSETKDKKTEGESKNAQQQQLDTSKVHAKVLSTQASSAAAPASAPADASLSAPADASKSAPADAWKEGTAPELQPQDTKQQSQEKSEGGVPPVDNEPVPGSSDQLQKDKEEVSIDGGEGGGSITNNKDETIPKISETDKMNPDGESQSEAAKRPPGLDVEKTQEGDVNAGGDTALDNTNDENGEGEDDTEDIDSSDNYDASQAETNENLDTTKQKQSNQGQDTMNDGPYVGDDSNFMAYFLLLSIVCIIAYLVFHNKQKILALILEGRRAQGNRRRSGGRVYRKLDSTVEDSMDLNRETSLRQVIY